MNEIDNNNLPTQKKNTHSALATTMRIIGVLNIVGGLVIGISLFEEEVSMGGWSHTRHHPEMLFGSVLAGVISCIICFAIAKCVQAATVYLNSVKAEK